MSDIAVTCLHKIGSKMQNYKLMSPQDSLQHYILAQMSTSV